MDCPQPSLSFSTLIHQLVLLLNHNLDGFVSALFATSFDLVGNLIEGSRNEDDLVPVGLFKLKLNPKRFIVSDPDEVDFLLDSERESLTINVLSIAVVRITKYEYHF